MVGNLSIRSKLIGLLAVPVAGTVLLGVAGVTATWSERARAAQERRVAAVAGQAAAAVNELQEERVRAVAWAAGAGSDGLRELTARRRRADRALAAYRAGAAGLGPTGDPALDQAVAAAAARLDHLAVVRAEVDRRLLTPERTAVDHDAVVAALLVVARCLAGQLEAPAPTPAPAPAAATPIPAAAPAAAGPLQPVRLAAAAAVARAELNGVRAAAGGRLDGIDRALGAPAVRDARRLELALLEPAKGQPAAGDLAPWRAGLAARAGALRRVQREVAADLAGAAVAWSAPAAAGPRPADAGGRCRPRDPGRGPAGPQGGGRRTGAAAGRRRGPARPGPPRPGAGRCSPWPASPPGG